MQLLKRSTAKSAHRVPGLDHVTVLITTRPSGWCVRMKTLWPTLSSCDLSYANAQRT